jgi:hypothetical protein
MFGDEKSRIIGGKKYESNVIVKKKWIENNGKFR